MFNKTNKIEIDVNDEDEAGLIMRKFGYTWFLWGVGVGFIFGIFITSFIYLM